MRGLLVLVWLLSGLSATAQDAEIHCPGQNTIEMRWCASKQWGESNEALKQQLSPDVLKTWRNATQAVCAAAYAPYRHGTVYPQMVVGCDDRLNRVLLDEFSRLGEREP